MTPQTGISVCGTLTFPQANVPSCTGGGDIANNSCVDPVTSDNSVWYKFHCYQSGTLGFLIQPLSPIDDYDWVVMDVTGRPVTDVYNFDLGISTNLSAETGSTGCTAAGFSDVNCAGNTSQYNRMPNLVAGNDYMLMVTNWSSSGLGYNLQFTGGTAQLTNNLPPEITNVGIVGCDASKIKISFSEDILCSSLASLGLGTEFSVTNGTNVITGMVSSCNTGSNAFTELTINLQSPLAAGGYNLVVGNGGDGNTLLDVCQEPMAAGQFPFTVASQAPVTVSGITFNGCAPTVLKVALTKPVTCGSITAAGSEFTITPGTHPVIAAQSLCSAGASYTDTILVVMQNPLPYGNYQLNIGDGADSNPLIDTCGTATAAGYNFPLVINQTTVAPVIQSVVFDECKPTMVVVNFDKPVACNSLSGNGSEFIIYPGAIPVDHILSSCGVDGYTTTIKLFVANNLPAGNFEVRVKNGNDGNTFADTCFSFIATGYAEPFVTTQAPPPVFDSVQFDKCMPSQIKVFYNHPIDCGSVTAVGVEFFITGPSPVAITSVSGDPATCSTSYSHWFILQLSQPISVFGTYTLHNRTSPLTGHPISDTCRAAQDVNETIAFNVLGKPSPDFTGTVQWGCVKDTIVLSHPGGNGINSWTWNFSDGTTSTGQTASHTFPVSTASASVQLIVSNGSCSDTLVQDFPLNNAFEPLFTASADSVCINKPVTFTSTSTGNNLQYQWEFGDNTQFTGQTPPPHSYASSDSFRVNLIVTNNHGCRDTAVADVFVTAEPVLSFTGLQPKYCTGDNVSLTGDIQGNVNTYIWNNGAAGIFNDQPAVSFHYDAENTYTITLSATDRFCGLYETSGQTIVYEQPSLHLGNDTTVCPGITIPIGVTAVNGYVYTWNTGATTSTLITDPITGVYGLQVDNNGCIATDDIKVTVLENCLIKVPGAFTPNNDGLNDRLRAVNAELARNFSLRVYNRFGQLLFSTKNPVDGWNGYYKGQQAAQGTYVWQLSYTDPITNQAVYEKGTSILIR